MKTSNLVALSLLAALYAAQAIAAEPVVAPSAKKAAPAAKPKTVKHQKDCVTKNGKPCHLKKHAGQTTTTQTATQNRKPAENIKPAVAAAVAAPAAAIAAKPEAKADAALSQAAAMQLAKKNNCFTCHAIDKKVIGPAWKEVAAKYRGDTGAEAKLANKIAKGGGGVWGVIPMTPFPQISEADRKTLSRFVLSIK
ncbi:MAG: c-type cytochrome [Gallionella sp.]|nr:c-type cytochrome [Gallionella sp.]